jgi:hypothetical protein
MRQKEVRIIIKTIRSSCLGIYSTLDVHTVDGKRICVVAFADWQRKGISLDNSYKLLWTT